MKTRGLSSTHSPYVSLMKTPVTGAEAGTKSQRAFLIFNVQRVHVLYIICFALYLNYC